MATLWGSHHTPHGLSALGPEPDAFRHRFLPPFFCWGVEIEERGNIPFENLNILLSSFSLDRLLFTQGHRGWRGEAKRCGCCGFSSHSTSLLRNWTRGLVCGLWGERKGPWILSLLGTLSQPCRGAGNADRGSSRRRENQPPRNKPHSGSSWCINIHCRARGVNSLLSPRSLPFMPFVSHRCHYCLMSTPPSQPLKWTQCIIVME